MTEQLESDLEVSTQLADGEPARILRAIAETQEAELLVVAAGGKNRVEQLMVGSVSAKLAADAPCPVVIAPPAAPSDVPEDGPVLCGFDASDHARRAADLTRALAARLGAEPVLVSVREERGDHFAFPAGAGASRMPATPRRGASSKRRDGPDDIRIVEEATGRAPAAALAEVARRERAQLLVVGSRGQGSIRSAVLGSVSADLPGETTTCPVVVVPPTARRLGTDDGQAATATDAA